MQADITDLDFQEPAPRPAPRVDIIKQYVAALTGSADTSMYWRLLPDGEVEKARVAGVEKVEREKRRAAGDLNGQRFAIRRNYDGSANEVAAAIAEHQAKGWGTFVVVNEGGRNAASITHVRALFVDADGVEFATVQWHVEPDFIVQRDATHWHAYWLVADCPLDQFQRMQLRLARHYGTDESVTDLPRVLRVPGTLHLKDPTHPHDVTFHQRREAWEGKRALAEILTGLAELPPEEIDRRAPSTSVGDPVGEEHLLELLRFASSKDLRRSQWMPLVAAIRAVNLIGADTGARRREIAHQWMRDGGHPIGDHDDDIGIDQVLDTMPPKKGGSGYGTILHAAEATGYPGGPFRPPTEERFARVIEQDNRRIAALVAEFNEKQAGIDSDAPGSMLLWTNNIIEFKRRQNGETPSARPPATTNDDPKPSRFKARKRGEYRDRPPALNLIDAMHLPQEGVALLVGNPGSLKSFIALGIVIAAATGRAAFGDLRLNLGAGTAIYAAGEGARGIEDKRIPAYEKDAGIDLNMAPLFTVSALPTAASERDVAEFFAEIDRAIASAGQPHRVSALDTLAKLMPGMNENDVGDTGKAIGVAERMVQTHGGLAIVTHHFNKQGESRGSTAIRAGVDWMGEVEAIKGQDGLPLAKLAITKTKDGAGEGEVVYFRGKLIQLGPEPDNASLVLYRIAESEYKGGAPAPVQDITDPRHIVATLAGLNAVDRDHGVETKVLAEALAPMLQDDAQGAWEARVTRLVKRLSERANLLRQNPRSLAPYAHKGEGASRNGTLWYEPELAHRQAA